MENKDSVSIEEKNALYGGAKINSSLNKKSVIFSLITYLLIILILGSFVYVRLLIYDKSKIYADLKNKREVLREENKELQRKIEALQFKNKITNYFEVQYEN